MATCERHPNVKQIVHGCGQCGAPQCCPACCDEATAEDEAHRREEALTRDLADANARCADLTARVDRERGARMAAEDGRDHAIEVLGRVNASLDECARLLGCERGGVVETIRSRIEREKTLFPLFTIPKMNDVPLSCDACDDSGWVIGDEPCDCQMPPQVAPTPEPVTWAVGDRVQSDEGYVYTVISVEYQRTNAALPFIDLKAPGSSRPFKWHKVDDQWSDLTRLPPESVVKPASMWCPATRGECDRPCVGAECARLAPDPRDSRIAELERELSTTRAEYGKAQDALIRRRSQMVRIREQLRGYAGVNASVRGVLRILNEGDV